MSTLKILPLTKSINKTLTIPGSKSYTNRALFLAAMSSTPVKIINPLISDDTLAMIECLKKLGIKISIKKDSFEVLNNITSIKNLSYDLDANESGVTLRFLLALSTIIPGVKTLYGKETLNKRPIGELVQTLQKLGATIKYLDKKGYPPIQISSSKLGAETIKIKGSISSQYTSALLMIAPLISEVKIEITDNQISQPYIDVTIDIMQKFGVTVLNKNYKKYIIPNNQKYDVKKFTIEGDLSSASYFFAIAALAKSTITIKNINPDTKQADIKLLSVLETMGNKIIYGNNQITLVGKGVKAININMQNFPDQVQTLAVLAAFAKGVTKISGISSLRVKETDRVYALQQELKKMGIKTSVTKNTLTIYGGSPRAAQINTYGDHRMAMAFAIAATKLPGMEIANPDVVSKTFPDFWKKLNSIGVKTKTVSKEKNIVLIGMRGSGKTTISKLLSKKLNSKLIDTDELVVKNAGLTIPEIVKKFGWDKIRKLEHEAIKDAADSAGVVISTGGGVVVNTHNIDLLKKNGRIFWLRCQTSTLLKRTKNDSNRPMLTNKETLKEEIEEILKQRKALYKSAADEIIDIDNLNATEVTNKIINMLGGSI